MVGRGGRGRGRGGRAGRGGGAKRGGPRLPATLSKEIFGEGSSGDSGRPRNRPPSQDRRRAEREERRDGAGGRQPDQPQRPQQQQRKAARKDGERPAAKRQKLSSRPSAGGGSMFRELLPAHLQAGAPANPEAELQRQLARKLGLKKGKTKMGGEDGLDEFLEELGGIDELFGSDGDGGGGSGGGSTRPTKVTAAAAQAGKKRKQAGLAAAGGGGDTIGSDEEDGEDGSDWGSSDDDGSLLAGLQSGGSELDGDSELDFQHDGASSSEEGEEQDEEEEEEEEEDGQQRAAASSGRAASGGRPQRQQGGLGPEEEGEEEAFEEGEDSGLLHSSSGSEGEQQRLQQQPAAAGRYVPPAARRAAAAAGGGAVTEAGARLERRARGLLNRLAEANLQGVVGELAVLYEQEGRRLVSDTVCGELISAAADGPRASARFAAVSAAAVAGLAGSVRSAEVTANFLDRLAARLEGAAASGDTLCCHNLTMVAAHLYLAGALKPDVVFSMLDSWRQRFTETDVSMIVTLLHSAGLQLRAGDPVSMKEFVVAVHERAGQARAGGQLSQRATMLLELVVDVKNNRRREEAKHGVVALSPAVAKWLKGTCGAADVALGGISWGKVLQSGKKGIWWMPEASDAQPSHLGGSSAALRAAAAEAAKGAVGGEGGLAGPELLKLAASLRMNTDVRRAVFCVVMGSEDCVDAAERLLRLGLKGEQEREVARVIVECCLQEKAWNAYYAHLLLRLCGLGKSHKMTLQFCFWDQLKEVAAMEVRRLTNLARLMGAVLATGVLPSSMLKVADFAAALSAREVLFWRIFFEHLLASCKTSADAAAFFKRLRAKPELKALRVALAAFLRRSVGPWLAAKEPGSSGLSSEQLGVLLRRLRGAEKALTASSAS